MITHRSFLPAQRLCAFTFLAVAATFLSSSRADESRLVNISTRAHVGTSDNILIAGFVIPPGSNKSVLVRAAGPALSSFGLSNPLANPKIVLADSTGTAIASNDDWDLSLASTFSSVGAFAFQTGSRDSALQVTLTPGLYSALVSGSDGGTGVGLVEVYEVDDTNALINISSRGFVGTGESVLISGFVVASGSAGRLLLLRGGGPSLANFGVTGVLSNPRLTLYNAAGTKIAENDDWGTPVTANDATAAELSNVFSKAGAYTYASSSQDSALLVGLEPGAYSIHVGGVNSTTGIALAEVYDITSSGVVPTAPAITTHPTSLSVASGGSATFSTSATGTAVLQYQWYKDGAALSGATASSYTIGPVATSHAGNYTVTLTNIAGSSTSNAATLTVANGGSSGSSLSATAATAAQAFLDTLSSTQRSSVQLSWTLDAARRWSNLPAAMVSRNGISWGSLSTAQKTAASALITAALGTAGAKMQTDMQATDDYLNANGGGSTYGSGFYYLAFLGTPSSTDFWMLQLTGHHLTFNVAFNGTYKSPTPLFLAVEPKGSFTLNGTTYDAMQAQRTAFADLGASLTSYSGAQLSGTYSDLLFGANGSGNIDSALPKSYPTGTTGRGVLYTSLSATDQEKVKTAIRSYVNLQASEYTDDLLAAYLSDTALAQTYVAYAGAGNVTSQNSYLRIDGPRVWIEFSVPRGVIFSSDIHYHTIWRDKSGDYGGNF